MRHAVLLLMLLALPSPAFATWSVIAVDRGTGRVVIASATCVDRDDEFLKGAKARGMLELKGHRAVGGMRASLYNAMPIEGVQRLVDYMREFERKHG